MAKKIAVGYDGSNGSKRALEEAIRIALLEHASLHLITIHELPRYPATMGEIIEEQDIVAKHVEDLHKEVDKMAEKRSIKIETNSRIDHPAKGIVDYINETKPDLLIIGHSGQSGVWGSFLGTTADKVVRHAACSVLVVR
jgi:nucleotide-binding universal stress UspA family protein